MATQQNTPQRSLKGTITLVLTILVLAGSLYAIFTDHKEPEATKNNSQPAEVNGVAFEDRKKAYMEAEEKIAAMKETWPQTEEALIRAFWDAASRKDFDTCLLYCPGAVKSDFSMFDQFTPSPAKSVGAPEPHPTEPNQMLIPVNVPFPGFPNKTIKMATMRMNDGRLAINGQYTIWW